ncbi:hypothetical protein HY546_02320 [archaeon]|nr:hypothetical protein [archaeon]
MVEQALLTAILAWGITVLLNALIIFLAAGVAGAAPTYWRAIVAAAVGSVVVAFIPTAGPISALIGFVAWLLIIKGSFALTWTRTLITAALIWLLNVLFALMGLTAMLLLPRLVGI